MQCYHVCTCRIIDEYPYAGLTADSRDITTVVLCVQPIQKVGSGVHTQEIFLE